MYKKFTKEIMTAKSFENLKNWIAMSISFSLKFLVKINFLKIEVKYEKNWPRCLVRSFTTVDNPFMPSACDCICGYNMADHIVNIA